MRASSRIVVSAVLFLPLLAACGGSRPQAEQASVATAFTDGNSSTASQARPAQEAKARADIEDCRKQRQQGAGAAERSFPCEAFLGE